MALTRGQSNRKIRQEALRDQLAAQGHVQHVVEILTQLIEPKEAFEAIDLQRYKLIIDTKLALIKKYLPDLKQIELTGEDGEAIKTENKWKIEIIRPDAKDSDT